MERNQRQIRLENILGFNGNSDNVLKTLTGQYESVLVYAIGGLLVLEQHQTGGQRYLKIHDMPITAIAVSPRNNMVATGQEGSIYQRTPEAPIVLTDTKEMKVVHTFHGIQESVIRLEFSQDGQFLAASGACGKFLIWNMDDLTMITSKIDLSPIKQMYWSYIEMVRGKKFPTYHLASSSNDKVSYHDLEFELGSMKYYSKSGNILMPNTGLTRVYTSNVVDRETGYYYLGTQGGEIVAFDLKNRLYKAVFQIGNSALTNLVYIKGRIYAGFHNGCIRILQGKLDRLETVREARLSEHIRSLAYDASTDSLFVGTSKSSIYKLGSSLGNPTLFRSGHTASVEDIDGKDNVIVSIDKLAILKIWVDCNLLHTLPPSSQSPNLEGRSVSYCPVSKEVIAGYSNGNVTCFDLRGTQKWEIPNTHKGGVSSLLLNNLYIITAGHDGIVRIWNRSIRNLIGQVNLHSKQITRVLVDFQKPHIFHTCSLDKQIVSYDMKLERKIKHHSVKNGLLYDMAQKRSPEFEMITCGFNTPLYFWDIDVVEPTAEVSLHPHRCMTIGISDNGNYFVIGTEKNDIFIFETETKKCINRITGHSAPINKTRWISNNSFISASMDGSICVWKL